MFKLQDSKRGNNERGQTSRHILSTHVQLISWGLLAVLRCHVESTNNIKPESGTLLNIGNRTCEIII